MNNLNILLEIQILNETVGCNSFGVNWAIIIVAKNFHDSVFGENGGSKDLLDGVGEVEVIVLDHSDVDIFVGEVNYFVERDHSWYDLSKGISHAELNSLALKGIKWETLAKSHEIERVVADSKIARLSDADIIDIDGDELMNFSVFEMDDELNHSGNEEIFNQFPTIRADFQQPSKGDDIDRAFE